MHQIELNLFGQLVDLDGQRFWRYYLILKVFVIAMDGIVAAIVLALEFIGHNLHIAGTYGAAWSSAAGLAAISIRSRFGRFGNVIAQHMRVEYVVYIVHGAQVIDKHLALRYLCIVHARIIAARIASDLHVTPADRLEYLIVPQIPIVQTSAHEVIQ